MLYGIARGEAPAAARRRTANASRPALAQELFTVGKASSGAKPAATAVPFDRPAKRTHDPRTPAEDEL
jgi:hypothetical protein